ncbi:MAG TPA: type IV pilus secretin PilQ [Smithellaceae bacterium]|nr:type IV pilus secretin PilQ [Smithellaceae bacterium]
MKCLVLRKGNIVFGLVLFLLAICIGCAGETKATKKDPFFEKWSTMAEASQGHSPGAEPKKIDLASLAAKPALPPAENAAKQMPTKKINLTMRQADLKAVLRAMARSVDINLLMKNDIKGEVSVDFKGVAWDQAFTGLLRTYGLSHIWEGNIIRVMTIEDIERDLKQKMSMRDMQWVEPLLQPVVINIDYTDPKKLADTLQDFLTKDKDGKPRGSVKVDEHSNSLVISAVHDDLVKMLPIIEKLDKPTPQILIKANIVETTKSTARDLGIMWGGQYRSGSGNFGLYPGGTRTSATGSLTPTADGPIGIGGTGFGSNFPAANLASTASASLGLVFGTIGGNLLEAQLQALQNESKLNILSSPSLAMLDNQKAFTENGERVPYTTMESASGSTAPTYTTKFEDVVLRLEITPHVIDGKNLKMTILVKKDEVDMTRKSSLGDPYIIKKQTQTVLIVQDGETIVISGLTKQTKTESEQGLPLLKDVPILGWLFKSSSKNDQMEEVLIFITPRILQVGKLVPDASSGGSGLASGAQTGK